MSNSALSESGNISKPQLKSQPGFDFYCWPAGDADCLILKTPAGNWGLIDCGLVTPNPALRHPDQPWPGVNELKAFLEQHNVTRLSFALLTHPENDHSKGFYSLFLDLEVDLFFVPPGALRRRSLEKLDNLLQERQAAGKTTLAIISDGDVLWEEPQHDFKLLALGPTNRDLLAFATTARRLLTQAGLPADTTTTELAGQTGELIERLEADAAIPYVKGRPPYNRLSVVALAFYGKSRLLLGADALTSSWRELAKSPLYRADADPTRPNDLPANLRAQVFKVPHHGANDGMPLELAEVFLEEGAVSVVSSSGHSFASPSADLLSGLTRLGRAPYCTGRSAWCPGRFVGRPCCGLLKIQLFADGRPPLVQSEQNWRTVVPVKCSLEKIVAQTLEQKR